MEARGQGLHAPHVEDRHLSGSRPQVGVVGPGDGARPQDLQLAFHVGELLAQRGAHLICGGLSGVMEAACAGAVKAGGLTVGFLPGIDPRQANRHLSVIVPTGLGEARNVLVIRSSSAVIGLGGSLGTLSELALAAKADVPVALLRPWRVSDEAGRDVKIGVTFSGPEEAVEWAVTQALARTV